MIDIDSIKNAIRKDNVHFPKTSLISLENTHNMFMEVLFQKIILIKYQTIAKKNK